MNPWVKHRPWLCKFIKILLKAYTTKLHRFSTLSPSSGGKFIVFWTSQTDIRESKFVINWRTSSNELRMWPAQHDSHKTKIKCGLL